MRPQTINDTNLVDALGGVFSRYGYEGASLRRLSEASGLKKASLYHRFPAGKDGIIEAVLQRAGELFDEMLAPAYAEGAPIERAHAVAKGIRSYYDSGAKSCLIVALSVADSEQRESASHCIDAWHTALKTIAVDAGKSKTEANDVAMELVALIEGALVIASTSGNLAPFDRAIKVLPERLTT